MEESLYKLLQRVNRCATYENLKKLEENFNSVGLTIQSSISNNLLLCKIVENAPSSSEMGEDHIFIASSKELDNEISERRLDILSDFIKETADEPAEVAGDDKEPFSGASPIAGDIVVMHEDIEKFVKS